MLARHAAASARSTRAQTRGAGATPLRVSDLLARINEPAPAEVTPGPLLAADFIAAFRSTAALPATPTDELADRRDRTRSTRKATWRSAVPALIGPAVTPVRAVIRRPVLAAAVVVVAASATAAASAPTAGVAHKPATTTVAAPAPGAQQPQNRVVDTPSSSSSSSKTRVSRDKRTPLSTNARPAMKKGQTVPGTWILPAPGTMTTCFCMRWGVMHNGIDIAKGYGVPIKAVGDGVVVEAGPAEGFGNWVVIQHSNGDVSIYGHMESFSVHKGERVKAGEIIAHEGSMGYSTGPHLHFEVHKGGLEGPPIDPVPWLRARGVTIPTYDPNG